MRVTAMDVTEALLKISAAPSTDILIKELNSKTVKDIKFIENERWEIYTTDGMKYDLEANAAEKELGGCIPLLTLSREATPEEIEEYKGRRKPIFEAMKRCREEASAEAMTECMQKEVKKIKKKIGG